MEVTLGVLVAFAFARCESQPRIGIEESSTTGGSSSSFIIGSLCEESL